MTTAAQGDVIGFDQLSNPASAESGRIWDGFEGQLAGMDDSDAQSHLKAGRPIYYYAEELDNRLVREWPDGRRDYVGLAEDDTIISLGAV